MANPPNDAVVAGQQLLPVIAQIETGGEADADMAVSHKGAVGRYQIMPGTARLYGFEPERLTEPKYNEQVASTILNDLWRRYQGDASAVLVAYNAGPKTADKWLASGRSMGLPDETAGYIDKASKLVTGGNLQRDAVKVSADDGTPPLPDPPQRKGIAPGQAMIQKALDAGYTNEEVLGWKAKRTQEALQAGYKPEEIDAYWGESPPQLGDAERLIKNNISSLPPDQAQKLAANPLEAMKAGWGMSTLGLATQGGLPDMTMPQDASTWMKVTAATAQFAGDIPATVAGFFGGAAVGGSAGTAVGGPVGGTVGAIGGAGFGSAAVPQAIREALIAGYRRGEVNSWSDFAGVLGGATTRTLKAGIVGAIAAPLGAFGGRLVGGAASRLAGAETIEIAGAGVNEFLPYTVHNGMSRAVGAGADLAAQTAVFGSVGAALDGRMPDKADFITGGMFALGFHLGAKVVGGRQRPTPAAEAAGEGMEEVFRETGYTPWEAANAARRDPVLRQELVTIDVNGERVQPTWNANAKDNPPPYMPPEPLKLEPPEGSVPKGTEGTAVVDGLGLPKIMYHGSARADLMMDKPGLGMHFTQDPGIASDFAGKYAEGGNVQRVYLNIKNPLRLRDISDHNIAAVVIKELERVGAIPKNYLDQPDVQARLFEGADGLPKDMDQRLDREIDIIRQELQKQGYDGIVYRNEHEGGGDAYIPFSDSQIIPADGAGGGNGGGQPPKPPAEQPKAGAEDEPPPQLDEKTLNEIASEFIGGEQKDKMLDPAKWYRQWVSELGPARAIDKLLAAKGYDLTRNLGIEDMFRQTYASDSRLGYVLNYGGIKLGLQERPGIGHNGGPPMYDVVFEHDESAPSFREISKQVQKNGGDLQGWTNWMVAQRANDKEIQGFDTGHPLSMEQRSQLIAIGQSKYKGPTQQLQKLLDSVLNYVRDSGVFSQEQVDAMRRDNPFYITFRRMLGDDNIRPPMRSGRNFRVSEPTKRFQGGDELIMNPIVALVDNIHTMFRMADRNRATGSLIALAEKNGILEDLGLKQLSAPEIKATIAEPGSDVFKPYSLDPEASYETYAPFLAQRANRAQAFGKDKFVLIRNGKVEVWKATDETVADLIRGAETPGETDPILRLAAFAARSVRSGIVSAPDFPVRNVLRDQIGAYILDPNSPPPILTWLKGAFEVFGQGERYKAWLRNGGGGGALVEMDKAYFHRGLAEILEDTGALTRVWNTVRHPIEAAQMVSERIDAASRVGYTEHVAETRPDIEPVKAATASRKAYLDFVEKGTAAWLQRFARMVPFMRPSILGLKQTGEAIAGDPAGALMKGMLAITLPTVALYVLNYLQDEFGDLPEDQKYRNLPRWQRDGYFIVPSIGGVRARWPMPPVLGQTFGGLVNRALDHFAQDDPAAFKDWAQMMASAIIPPFVPTLILPPVEWWANRSTFTGKALVPEAYQDATGPMQYTSATTEPAKMLSRWIYKIGPEVSPIVIENFVREWGGPVGMQALRALNVSMAGFNNKPWEIADFPFAQSFFVRNPGMNAQPIQEFYDLRKDYEAARRDLKLAMKRTAIGGRDSEEELNLAIQNILPAQLADTTASALQAMHTTVQAIEQAPVAKEDDPNPPKGAMTIDEKRQQIDDLVSNMITAAKTKNTILRNTMKKMREMNRGG